MPNNDPQEILTALTESVAATEVVIEEVSAAPAEVEEAVAVTSEESVVGIVAEETAADTE